MKLHPPTLKTERLILRPFSISDAESVQALAGDRKIYETTLNVPHPYEDGMAEKWISSHLSQFYNGNGVNLAVTLRGTGDLIGAIGLGAAKAHKRAELGYWIGAPFWNKGYCTEASKEMIEYLLHRRFGPCARASPWRRWSAPPLAAQRLKDSSVGALRVR